MRIPRRPLTVFCFSVLSSPLAAVIPSTPRPSFLHPPPNPTSLISRKGYSRSVLAGAAMEESGVWGIPMGKQVFCNRSLNMKNIVAVGFDMDYTLAQYMPETFESLAYNGTIRKLVYNLAIPPRYPEGLLGLNRNAISFTSQVESAIDGKFSYCLPSPAYRSNATFLRFGKDIVPFTGTVYTVPFEITRTGLVEDWLYYFEVIDISIGTKRLGLLPGTFGRGPDGSGGFIVDSGTPFTRLVKPAFESAMSELVKYFSQFGAQIHLLVDMNLPLQLCYQLDTPSFRNYPTMTFHFPKDQELKLFPSVLFYLYTKKIFCWTVLPNDYYTLLGEAHQQNKKFVFDITKKELSFSREDCVTNG